MNAIKKILFSFLLLAGSFLVSEKASANADFVDLPVTSGYVVVPAHDQNTVLVCSSGGDSGSRYWLNSLNLGTTAMTQLFQFGTYQRVFYLINPPTGAFTLTSNVDITTNYCLSGQPTSICTLVKNVDSVTPIKTTYHPSVVGSYGGYYPNGTTGDKLLSLFVTTNNNTATITSSNSEMLSTVRYCGNTWHTYFVSGTTVESVLQLVSYGNLSAGGDMYFIEFNTSVTPLQITSPQDNANIYQNQNTTVSGTCPVNGMNQLAIQMTNAPHNLPALNYNIACSNGQFSTVIQYPYSGAGPLYIYDVAYQTNSNSNFMSMITVNSGSLPFAITSPTQGEMKIKDSWITVSGTCPTNGADRIALTNNCSSFANLSHTVDCSNNAFSAQFYYDGVSNWVAAVEKDSQAGDCVDYDSLMDVKEISGVEVIEGYPDDWHFNYSYYDDYDIEINSPKFDMPALTLPISSTSTDMSFRFVYPMPLSPNVIFSIKQYDKDGNLLNDNYHTKALYQMTDTNNYTVNLAASSSAIHYVVQLTDNGNLKRQFPFGVFVSSFDYVVNPDSRYLFPRLVEKLKKKVIFNYYFSFYDGFYTLFNNSNTTPSSDALDVSFKSVSSNKQYNLDIPIFKGSDPQVKDFADRIRPYAVSFLWIAFALYVVMRVSRLWNSNNE